MKQNYTKEEIEELFDHYENLLRIIEWFTEIDGQIDLGLWESDYKAALTYYHKETSTKE